MTIITKCAFAGDISVMRDTEEDLQHNLIHWDQMVREHGNKHLKKKFEQETVEKLYEVMKKPTPIP